MEGENFLIHCKDGKIVAGYFRNDDYPEGAIRIVHRHKKERYKKEHCERIIDLAELKNRNVDSDK